MKLFQFQMRSTRSGTLSSPFPTAIAIQNTSFNLSAAVRLAHEQGGQEEDPILLSPPTDPHATAFWSAAASSTAPATSPVASPLKRPHFDVSACEPHDQSMAPMNVERPHTSDGTDLSGKKNKRRRRRLAKRSMSQVRSDCDKPAPANLKRAHQVDDYNLKGKNRNLRTHRKRRDELDDQSEVHGHHPLRPEMDAAHVSSATPYKTKLNVNELPTSSCGYTARSTLPGEGVCFKSLQEALDIGYTLVEWDGKTAMPLVCSEGRIFAVLAGQMANDPTWAESCKLAYDAMMAVGSRAVFSEGELHHRRGDFPAVNVGVTMGLGATYPTNLSGGKNADMLNGLLKNEHIIRLANFADSAFNMWAPNVHKHYRVHLNALFTKLPYLRRIFPRSVFPAAAFNFGGDVCTKTHRDCLNSCIGWCGIFGLGPYDPKRGGHLVLPDLKLVIEFPPGALILIPSATLTHANIPVQPGDNRLSFTQYGGGGLFRYVDNGYCTETELRKKNRKMYNEMMTLKATQWQEDLTMYDYLKDRVSTPLQKASEKVSVL